MCYMCYITRYNKTVIWAMSRFTSLRLIPNSPDQQANHQVNYRLLYITAKQTLNI